jgi:hypothetical protein
VHSAASWPAAAPSCSRSLYLDGLEGPLPGGADAPELLRAIAALPQLQHLCLNGLQDGGQVAVLAGCRQLKQLTLYNRYNDVAEPEEAALVALMRGLPKLRLLRLLACSKQLSQDRCQALVGQLGLCALQVDVVVADGSARAEEMLAALEAQWREA